MRAYMIEAHEIVPGLWQGSKPATGRKVAEAGFDVAVFCAREWQPSSTYYPGVQIIHAPNEDDSLYPMTKEELQTAVVTATRLQRLLGEGKQILVTCMAGINRSGLVVALTLHKAFGYSGRTCIDIVRERRQFHDGQALRNPQFVDVLLKLPGQELVVLPGIDPIVPP